MNLTSAFETMAPPKDTMGGGGYSSPYRKSQSTYQPPSSHGYGGYSLPQTQHHPPQHSYAPPMEYGYPSEQRGPLDQSNRTPPSNLQGLKEKENIRTNAQVNWTGFQFQPPSQNKMSGGGEGNYNWNQPAEFNFPGAKKSPGIQLPNMKQREREAQMKREQEEREIEIEIEKEREITLQNMPPAFDLLEGPQAPGGIPLDLFQNTQKQENVITATILTPSKEGESHITLSDQIKNAYGLLFHFFNLFLYRSPRA